MKWPQLVLVFLGVLAVAIAVRFRDEKPSLPQQNSGPPPATGPRPLPPSVERPGMMGRRMGLMRVYLAVSPDVSLIAVADGVRHRAVTVPISLVLENDTYQPLLGANLGWTGARLATVRVAKVAEGERDAEVFEQDVPLPTRADWLSAERRSFTVDWPLRETVAGTYRISAQLGLPDQPSIELLTRVQ